MINYDYETGEWVGEKTGHREYAFTDSLSVDDKGEVTYGYDGSMYVTKFSVEERRALADLMIARWSAWREEQK